MTHPDAERFGLTLHRARMIAYREAVSPRPTARARYLETLATLRALRVAVGDPPEPVFAARFDVRALRRYLDRLARAQRVTATTTTGPIAATIAALAR
jgi:hypothetical protein